MRDPAQYLKWCLRQRKGAILVEPSPHLVRAYLKKSETALRSMELNAKGGIVEWAVSASYYAKYFAVYALLSKIGIKSEIHDCTVALFEYLFAGTVSSKLLEELKESKEQRIEMQYYTTGLNVNVERVVNRTRSFVLEVERQVDELDPERAFELRNKVKRLSAHVVSRRRNKNA